MRFLAIDTATSVAAVGVVSDLVGEGPWEVEVPAKNHAPTLMTAIDEVLRQAGAALGDVDGIAVGIGPGSFTGVRIGVATAKALALATGRPAFGVSTLEAMARRGDAPRVVVAIPSRRGEVFAAAFERGVAVLAPCAIETAALEAWVAGQGVQVARVGVGAESAGPRARDVAALAFVAASVRRDGQGDALAPVYLGGPSIQKGV